MIVPRSAYFISSDDEFSLYAVTTFIKHSNEFVHKVRERKWVPRDYKFKEGGKEEEAKELRKTEAEEKRVWGETLRLGRTGWSEAVMGLVHVIVLRVFVESVLRYGLPLDFVAALVKVRSSLILPPALPVSTNAPRRRIENATAKPAKEWTPSSLTWLAMPSGETAKVVSRKTRE